MIDDRGARGSRARDDVDDPGRKIGILKNLGKLHGREWGCLGGLQNDRIAGREGWRDFPRGHEKRKIPRDDLTGNAERRGFSVGKRVGQLVRPAGVIEKVIGRQWDVDRF